MRHLAPADAGEQLARAGHPLDRINAAAKRGREHGLIVHMDGARLMNACVKLGVSPADMLAEIDSVSLCLSKGLGAPRGRCLPDQRR